MTNYLNEKRNYAVIIAAILCTLVIMVGGMITGLVYAVREHNITIVNENDKQMAQSLLSDAAQNLVHSMSALRLCNEVEPAEVINRTALVHTVRAETALEFHDDDYVDNRSREAFLNDMATVLHSYSAEETLKMSDLMYEYTTKFYDSISSEDGTYGEFEYNGELLDNGETDIPSTPDDEPEKEITEDDIAQGAQFVKDALGTTRTDYVGAWNGNIEYYIERDGTTGYAMVRDGKIIEFSFMRSGEAETDVETAKEVALASAEACGYADLQVKWCEVTGKSVSVIMCKSYDGALACDDYATAVVYGNQTVAFTAGNCEREHNNIPEPKVSESEAHNAVKQAQSDGVLSVRVLNGKERICYEYRYELEDGVHYVYVCAENGKQIEVR